MQSRSIRSGATFLNTGKERLNNILFRIPEQIGERRCRDVFGRTGRKPGRDDPEITKRDPVSKKAERG